MSSVEPVRGIPAEDGTDTLALISSYRRHAMLFAIVTIVVGLLVTGVLLIQRKSYTAQASLLMVTDNAQATPTMIGEPPPKPVNDAQVGGYVDTQVEVLKSRELATKVVDDLKLATDPDYITDPLKTAEDKVMHHEDVITHVQNHLKVHRAGETYVVNIDYTDHSSIKAAKIANYFAQAFIDEQRQIKATASKTASGLLDAQLNSMRSGVQHDQAAVAEYQAAHNLVTTSAQGATLNENNIANLSQQLAQQQAAEAEAEARYNTAREQVAKGSNGEDVGEALLSPVVQDLRRQRALIVAKLGDMETHLGPRHPDLITANQQLSDIDAQIHIEVERILSNLQAQAQVARQRTSSVLASLNATKAELVANNADSVGLGDLQRNADSSKTLYESYLTKAKETAQQQQISQPDAQVTSAATPPVIPSSPNLPLDILVGVVLGLGAGAGAVVVRRALDSTLRTQDDVEARLAVPYLAGIPTVTSSIKKPETKVPIEAIVKHPLSGFAEAFRSLTASVTLVHGAKLIAITSSLPGEGKTTSSICLAGILSLAGSRALAIDCDLRRRSMNGTLGANATKGLLDVLKGDLTLEEAILVDERTRAHYLLLPKSAVASAKSPLDTPEFDALLARVRESYDYVILDFPPLLPIVDGRVLAPKVDAVVLLCRWQQTPKRAAQHAIRLLRDVGVEPAGVALTMIDLKAQQRYGYGDSGYYYNGYSDYYLEGKAS